jgi:pimeloyl-ACP methyl ester carboxylesterase
VELYILAGIIGVVLAYGVYHTGRIWDWRKRIKLYGEMLTGADGLQTFYSLRGTGTYTLVIVTASGSSALEWEVLTDELARTFRVLRYDRYGYSWSSRPKTPRTPQNLAEELHALLTALHIQDNIILVGHSFGGLITQQYARLYPQGIVGALFIDPYSAEDSRFKAELPPAVYKQSGVNKFAQFTPFRWLEQVRLFRLLKPLVRQGPPFYYFKGFSRRLTEDIWQGLNQGALFRVTLEEYNLSQQAEHLTGLSSPGGFPAIPINILYHAPQVMIADIVKYGGLTEAEATQVETLWQAIVRGYLKFSTNSEFLIAEHSGHLMHVDHPEVVVHALDRLVKRIEEKNNNSI